jgi:mannose-6-phosphate isomerase
MQSLLDFRSLPVPYLPPTEVATGVEAFVPDVPDFTLLHVVTDATLTPTGPAIAICTAGSFAVGGERLEPGDSVYVDGEESLAVSGEGDLFVATVGAMPL